jgi:phage baseplate assembly protein W
MKMSEVDVETGQLIDSMTITDQEYIKRTVLNIAASQRGTVPYMRDMGVDELLPDSNSPADLRAHAADVAEEIGDWEERAQVSDVHYTAEHKLKVVMGIE